MTEEEYNKLSTFEKIDYDINIELYMKYNDQIASINDHLGDIYGYSDLKDIEDLEKHEELMLYKKALKEKCDAIDKGIEYIEDEFYEVGGCVGGSDLPYQPIQDLLDILKGK